MLAECGSSGARWGFCGSFRTPLDPSGLYGKLAFERAAALAVDLGLPSACGKLACGSFALWIVFAAGWLSLWIAYAADWFSSNIARWYRAYNLRRTAALIAYYRDLSVASPGLPG